MAEKGKKAKDLSFEQRLEQLEALAGKLEEGELPLRELMQTYEEGMQLSRALEGELEAAQARMLEVKQGKDGQPKTVPSQVAQQASLLDELPMEES